MTVTLISDHPCPVCGYLNKGVTVMAVRVNKNTIAQVKGDRSFGAVPRWCRECHAPIPADVRSAVRLAADDQAKVDAYRARRGWPVAA